MFKALAYLSLTASAVTLYVHIRNHDLPHFFGRSRTEASENSSSAEIVVASFRGNTLAERWQTEATPAPTAGQR